MSNKLYTVQYKISLSPDEYATYDRNMRALNHISNFALLKTEDASRVKYPPTSPFGRGGAVYDVRQIVVTFDGKVSKDKVEAIVDYWNSINFVAGVKNVDWELGNAKISFDPLKSPSRDLNKHNILESLLDLIENGSHVRKNHPFGQAVEGVGKNKVISIVGK